MSYQVLARKWRPRNFEQVQGQQHAVRVLTHAVKHDRTHHAYLFTGTRGVGKTTLARILAKAFNCESRSDYEPCCECSICKGVDEGRFIDLIEVDAASRTKVEDTRELLDNVQYAPAQGRYKVYLIDEVHMLSAHSFNALLKTLEEPPGHVKFLLATTDPQKIPVTVLSRCLQLNLKALSADQIREQMVRILSAENLVYEEPAITVLADAAEGSMRDGLSLLDQAIALGDGQVQTTQVQSMLGIISRRPIVNILSQIATANASGVFDSIRTIAEYTPDFNMVLQQLLVLIHDIALMQMVPSSMPANDNSQDITELANTILAEDLQLYYQIGLIGQRDLKLAPSPRVGFEMVLLRMLAFRPECSGPRAGADKSVPVEASGESVGQKQNQAVTSVSKNRADSVSKKHADDELDWNSIVEKINLSGMAKELATNSVLDSMRDGQCTLLLEPGHGQLRNIRVEKRLEEALQQHFDIPVKLEVKLATEGLMTPANLIAKERKAREIAAEESITRDDGVRALREAFDAEIMSGSTEPLEKKQ